MGEEEVRVVQPDNPVPMWYENITLDEAERFIASNLRSAVRNVIAIGYYLKNIRDNGLFREAGCENIWDYAWERFGFSKSTASRYMTRNDRFSRGGNSPILDEKYRDFNKSQLQEMLSLTDSELEQVTPDMTVRQIREIHRPAEKPVPYVALPGQIELEDLLAGEDLAIFSVTETNAPEEAYTVSVEDMLGGESVATSQQMPEFVCESSSEPEKSAEEMAEKTLSAYGTPKRVYPPDSLIAEEGCEGGHDCFSCAMDCRIRQEDRYCREAPLGNPFPCEIVKGGFTELPEGCQFLNHDLAYHCAGSGEPDPCCKDCQDPCEYICGRAMKALDQKTKEASQTEEWAEPEEIIDSEFSEASERLEPIEYDRNTLLKMISETKEQLELMKDYWIRNQSLTYAKYAMKLKAYENLLLLHDQEPEAVDAAMKERDEKFGQVEVELYFAAFGLALEELHGFNQEQITMVWKKADQYIKGIIDGDETKETLQQKLLDRANVMCSFQ